MPTPGSHGVGSVAPTGAHKGIISRASSSPPCSRTVPWPKHLFSSSNIPQLDGSGRFSSEKELYTYIQTSTPPAAPLVQHECQRSQLTPLDRLQQIHPTRPPTHAQPVNTKPVSTSPLSQTPTKQLQQTQILALQQPC